MAFTEDLTVFAADFGEPATLGGVAVRVIFDAPGVALNGISATQPQVQLPSAQVPAAWAGATLALAHGSYTVAEHVPDGTGWSTLLLQRAA